MDAGELDKSTSGSSQFFQGCELSPTLATRNCGVEVEFDTHVLAWLGRGFVECDGVLEAKKIVEREWW